MGFLIRCKTRDGEGEVIMRGSDDGYVDFVREVNVTDPVTKVTEVVLTPYKFYTTLGNALDKLFRMRVNNRDAATLQELLTNVKEEREALRKEFDFPLPKTNLAKIEEKRTVRPERTVEIQPELTEAQPARRRRG